MKKRFLILTAWALAFCGTSFASPANKFDLNSDGRVDGLDASLLATMVHGLGTTGTRPALPGDPLDLNGDKVVSYADWREFTNYAVQLGGYPEALFDVSSPGQRPLLTAADKNDIALAVTQGIRNGWFYVRYDFNADGKVDQRDWAIFTDYALKAAPKLLLDADGNGVINGLDLDRMAQTIDTQAYDAVADLNADGVADRRDWGIAVRMANIVNPRAVYDVDQRSLRSQPVVTTSDAQVIGTVANLLSMGPAPSIRYDFTGDGAVSSRDWIDWVHFANLVLKQPDLVLDVDGNGMVDQTDLAMVQGMVGTLPVQLRFDVNGDGAVNAKDVAIISQRLASGPLRLFVGDVDRDNCVTDTDYALVKAAQGSGTSYPLFDPLLDVMENGFIGPDDLSTVSANMGQCR